MYLYFNPGYPPIIQGRYKVRGARHRICLESLTGEITVSISGNIHKSTSGVTEDDLVAGIHYLQFTASTNNVSFTDFHFTEIQEGILSPAYFIKVEQEVDGEWIEPE